MSQPEELQTCLLGEPPEGVFVQLNLCTDGRVTYRFAADVKRWPQTAGEMLQCVGALGLLEWQIRQWATGRMRNAQEAFDAVAAWLKSIPTEGVN